VEQLLSASDRARGNTIVARGQIDGVRCDDTLIDTGASCNFVRRSWAERVKLPMTPLKEPVIVTLADKRTAVSKYEVRVDRLCVHGSAAACTLLVMDELSNEVIVGLTWQRATGITITPGNPYDKLNGQPVRSLPSTRPIESSSTSSEKAAEWPRDKPIRLSAASVVLTGFQPTESRSRLGLSTAGRLVQAVPTFFRCK